MLHLDLAHHCNKRVIDAFDIAMYHMLAFFFLGIVTMQGRVIPVLGGYIVFKDVLG